MIGYVDPMRGKSSSQAKESISIGKHEKGNAVWLEPSKKCFQHFLSSSYVLQNFAAVDDVKFFRLKVNVS